jgi:DNA-binding GntR family transcriptional regulator
METPAATHGRPAVTGQVGPLPQRQMLGDDVYEALKSLIMDSAIPPQARLRIDGLARDLAVSPTPVREALARLESDGLVTRAALKGYSVAPVLSRAELEDLFGLRLLLEPWAAATAAARLDDELARGLRAELEAVPHVPEGSQYEVYKAVAAHDTRFHELLLAAAGNEAVRQAFERTHCHLHIFRLYYATQIAGDALAEHRRIAEAVLAGDAAGADAAMRTHLDESRRRLLVAYTTEEGDR